MSSDVLLVTEKQKNYILYLFDIKGFSRDNMKDAHSTRLYIKWKVPEGRKYLTTAEWMADLPRKEASRVIDLLLKFSDKKKSKKWTVRPRKGGVSGSGGARYSNLSGNHRRF